MANCNDGRVFSSGILSKHQLFRIIGDQLTSKDVKELLEKHTDLFPESLRRLICDGYSFFLALDSVRNVDNSDILKTLTFVNRMDLAQFANYRRRRTVEMDPVDQYLEQTAKSSVLLPSWMQRQSTWVRCNVRNKDTPDPVRPGPSSSTNECSSCLPSTSQVPGTSDKTSPSPGTSKATSQGVKRKRRRSSLTYNKSHNRLKRSRTVDALPCVPQCSNTPSVEEEASQRVTRSRTRSAGVSLSTGSESSEICPQTRRVTTESQSRVTPSKDCDENKAKMKEEETTTTTSSTSSCIDLEEIKKKVTCDIRLRVRAEYCYHDSALEGNIFSNKPELIERQFEKFMQANTILKSRDLGSIICDIKFSELTYLDAFWRDYINGSLLEALKGVFITDSLKQAVGHEAIKLLVNVDEDDYESGRFKLLQNLKD